MVFERLCGDFLFDVYDVGVRKALLLAFSGQGQGADAQAFADKDFVSVRCERRLLPLSSGHRAIGRAVDRL